MSDCECGKKMKIVDFIKSDGTTNRPYDRIILQCKCGAVVNTIYDPRDFPLTEKQLALYQRRENNE